MFSPAYARTMAAYNRWMNEKIYAACGKLSDDERKADRGAFFKSIHSTLNHLLWADRTWIARFTQGTPLAKDYPKVPFGSDLHADWNELEAARRTADADIEAWAALLSETWLASDFSWYSGVTKSSRTLPGWLVAAHMINHQTHHRGQITTLLSQYGIDPGDTDLMLMPLPA